jgi:prevent-host-death family protein
MDSKHTLSISEARKRIFELAEEVQKPNIHFTLTENGIPKAVLISADEYESWQETLEVSKEFPDLVSETNTEQHKIYSALEEILATEGFVLSDKGQAKYDASSKSKTSRKKRIK